MDRVVGVVQLAQAAVSSNLFGLACPFHCGPVSLPSLALSFLLGLISGIGLVVALLVRFRHSLWPPAAPAAPSSRLAGYLHEQPPHTLRHRHS